MTSSRRLDIVVLTLTLVFLSTLIPPSLSLPAEPDVKDKENVVETEKLLENDRDVEEFFKTLMTRENLEKYYGPDKVASFYVIPEGLDDPQLEGHSILGSLLGPRDEEELKADQAKVTFYLYTDPASPKNRTELFIGNTTILEDSGFDPSAPTKIITHGYLSNHQGGPGLPLKNAYMARGNKTGGRMNIILVDWWDLAGPCKPSQEEHGLLEILYFPPARNTELVGGQIARLIDFLIQEGKAKLTSFHLIGHSLGAHAMGWAARSITGYSTTIEGTRIPRVTALDPASPCFEHRWLVCPSSTYQSVNTNDTDFLDVIHTHGNIFGYREPLGHADFYPNSGYWQPGCPWGFFGLGSCSHSRAVDFMIESVEVSVEQPGFVALKCSEWSEFETGKCMNQSEGQNRAKRAIMGENCPKDARGQFFLETNLASPYRVEAKESAKTLTYKGEPCKDECAKRGYKYYWCNTADSWDYCAPAGLDTYGNECADRCRRAGKSYRWCNLKSGSWGYCSANKV